VTEEPHLASCQSLTLAQVGWWDTEKHNVLSRLLAEAGFNLMAPAIAERASVPVIASVRTPASCIRASLPGSEAVKKPASCKRGYCTSTGRQAVGTPAPAAVCSLPAVSGPYGALMRGFMKLLNKF
jgi:hypothetical protein